MRKILLVEDEELIREAYKAILSTEPYEIFTATDGREAIELCSQTSFDLILLDLMMPVMDGVGFLESCPPAVFAVSKIVILSNLSSGAELARAMSLGASKSVVKAGLSPRQLLSMARYEVKAG